MCKYDSTDISQNDFEETMHALCDALADLSSVDALCPDSLERAFDDRLPP